MCNYGIGSPQLPTAEEILAQLSGVSDSLMRKVRVLLLSTNGSVLSQNNVEESVLVEILKFAQNSPAETIIIETHIDTLSEKRLKMLRSHIPQKRIILEIGLESADPFVQKNCFLKEIPMGHIQRMLDIAPEYRIDFQFNVILGAPFLTSKEQIDDSEATIRWIIAKGAMTALFPMNIKPYTLLHFALDNRMYKPISHWAVPYLLNRFTEDELGNIDLAWYGNRQITYDDPTAITVFPSDCEACRSILQEFYHTYVSTTDGIRRRYAVKKVLRDARCDCINAEILNYNPPTTERGERVLRAHELLIRALEKDALL